MNASMCIFSAGHRLFGVPSKYSKFWRCFLVKLKVKKVKKNLSKKVK